jgi:hypothetical protein
LSSQSVPLDIFGIVAGRSSHFAWELQNSTVFLAWVAHWISGFCVALTKLPTRVALVLALALLFNNTAGAVSWLGHRLPHGAWVQLGLYVATAVLVILTWSRAGVFARGQMPPP